MHADKKGKEALAGVFSRESIDQVRNPEKLNEYIRVASPGTWILAAALILVVAALITWGVIGRIPEYFQVLGIGVSEMMRDQYYEESDTEDSDTEDSDTEDSDTEDYEISEIYCIVNPQLASAISLDRKDAVVLFSDGTRAAGTVASMSASPSSVAEVEESLESYAIDSEYVKNVLGLKQSDYWYELIINLDEAVDLAYWGALTQVNIVAGQNAPISYLFK